MGITPKRGLEDWIIARRAALELGPNTVINLGIGIPTMVVRSPNPKVYPIY